MGLTSIILCLVGIGLIGWAKVNDKAEAYGVLIPFVIGCLCLAGAVLLGITWWMLR